MPVQPRRKKAEMQAVSRVGEALGLQGVLGDGIRPTDATPVRELSGPGVLTAACGCGGSGFIYVQEANGNRFARECPCRRVAKIDAQLTRAGLPARYLAATFESYQPQHSSQSLALIKARGLVDAWPIERTRGLALTGTVGTGKTHLCVAMLRAFTVDKGATARFVDVRMMLKTIQESYSRKETSEAEILAPILAAEVVVLDELGAARVTDWTFDIIEHVINSRYNEGRATHVTTNLALRPPGWRPEPERSGPYALAPAVSMAADTLGDRIGARMLSRLHEMCDVLEVQGPDYRARGRG